MEKSFKILLLLLLPCFSTAQYYLGDNKVIYVDDETVIDDTIVGPYWWTINFDSLMIVSDTIISEVIWHEGQLDCKHDWCYKPTEYSLHETSNNTSIEKICRRCLQHEQYIRKIRYTIVKREEPEFYQLLKKIQNE